LIRRKWIMQTALPPKPSKRLRVIDLVRDAGVDVSDWANVKGGEARAGANPKYCYNWSFVEVGKVVVLNLWHAELDVSNDSVIRRFNLLEMYKHEGSPVRKTRADALYDAVRTAYMCGLPIRVILIDGHRRDLNDPNSKPSRTSKRELDPVPWAVTLFDKETGDAVVTRSAVPIAPELDTGDVTLADFSEGQQRHVFIRHRRREMAVRRAKLEDAARRNGGRIVCEVLNCGFDFGERYGELGVGYAHVHHLVPLKEAPADGRKVRLEELAVVCPNCHAMIHLGGECRPLEGLIPGKRLY
jgi:5-methylcytosine-specific restriction enzyme A